MKVKVEFKYRRERKKCKICKKKETKSEKKDR